MRKFISLLILFCALSCSKTEHSYFPIWKVSLELDLTFEDKELNGIGNYKTYIRGKTPGIGAMEYTGLGGILVRCNGINEYRAYDLACPYEKNATVRIEVDELGISAICPKCGSDVKIFIKGEPVYLCSNKDCNKFFGVVPFREAEELDYSSELFLKSLRESDDYLLMEDKVIFLGEASANDTKLREILYSSRIKQRKELILLYDQLKLDVPYIQYTFTETSRYQGKNLFVDLYYYNKIFFENNTWFANKGMRLYLDLLTRLINHQNINPSIYKKKTIIIPIADWSNDTNIWNYRYSLNPISIIYQLMINGMKSSLDKIFGSNDILFLAKDKYFKINFSELDFGNIKKLANTFKLESF